jgi:hypothetical protein
MVHFRFFLGSVHPTGLNLICTQLGLERFQRLVPVMDRMLTEPVDAASRLVVPSPLPPRERALEEGE